MLKPLFTFLAAILLFALNSLGVTYYVSPTGNDANSGTSAALAWRTVARAQQVANSLQPGDQILFQRGGKYPGKLTVNSNGNASNPIIIGAYGTGDAPEISGTIPVTGWTQWQGNIWRANVSPSVKYVWVNGATMTLARFPNSGWLTTSSGNTVQISSSGIPQASGYWNGGEIVRRTTNWSYERATISNQSSGTISHSAITYSYGNGSGWGFFLRNKLAALDMAGEWFHDAAAGHLYFWAPGNANPNNIVVEASVFEHGVEVGWQRQHIRVEGLAFRGQYFSGVHNMSGNHARVTGCIFDRVLTAIKSVGNNSIYSGNTVTRTFGSGMSLIETNSLVENNTFTDIAMQPGLGENAWGYYGMYILGNGNTVRGNAVENSGYSGIFIEGNTLVEKNVVKNAVAILNDGGGIYFDNASGAIIRDNIVVELNGDVTSSATNVKICHGIFFGMAVINNILVQRNTITRCQGSGIFVDHTQQLHNVEVRDNIMFNNRAQLSITDYSNAGGSPPYYVAQYNDVYTGNLMYSVLPEQFCMEQFNMHGSAIVNFGSFANNKYFNPYNEMSIRVVPTGVNQKHYSLEKWQFERGQDQGSTRSPLRLELFEVTDVLGNDMVPNGTFDSNVNGWFGWPTQGQITHDATMLDNGSLKVNFTNGSTSPDFYLRHNATSTNVQNGQWYQLKYSIQSVPGIHGNLRVEFKGQSQSSSPNSIDHRVVPFDNQRRDLSMIFQSNLTEPGQAFFTNHFTESTYWLDNVELRRVNVEPADPLERHILLYNESNSAQSFPLPPGCWSNVNGQQVSSPATVPPYGGLVLYRTAAEGCGSVAPQSVGIKVMLGGAINWSTGLMRTDLRAAGVLPTTEPYSALGFSLANSGASVPSSLFQVTGSQAIVDWVLVELRNSNAGHTVVEQRAALVRANGDVIATDGAAQIAFTNNVQGRHVAVRHRNHLGVMTADPLASSGSVVNFTSASFQVHGADAAQLQGGLRALWPGDSNRDGVVRFTGQQNDRDPLLDLIGGQVPTLMAQGYHVEDLNMDGSVKYTGTNNDADLVLQVIGGLVPTNVRIEQLP
jgi:hypothetical protein